MGLIAKTALGLSLLNGAALAERVADPFERQEHDYVLEGPSAFSEVFYASVNWHDSEGKHDDRIGDFILLETVLFGGIALALRLRDSAKLATSPSPEAL